MQYLLPLPYLRGNKYLQFLPLVLDCSILFISIYPLTTYSLSRHPASLYLTLVCRALAVIALYLPLRRYRRRAAPCLL